MINYLVVVGSVTSDQYEQARFDLLQLNIKPRVFRLTAAEWLLDDDSCQMLAYTLGHFHGMTPESNDPSAVRLGMAIDELHKRSRELILSSDLPIVQGSKLFVPAEAMFSPELDAEDEADRLADSREFQGDAADYAYEFNRRDERDLDQVFDRKIERAFVKRYLVNDNSTVVGLVIADEAWKDTIGWFDVLPADCKIYHVHDDGWVQRLG